MILKRKPAFILLITLLGAVWATAAQTWYSFSMSVDSVATPLANFSGVQAWPSIGSSLMVLFAAFFVALLSSRKFQRAIFFLMALFVIAVPVPALIQTLFVSPTAAPASLLGEVEKLTGIAQQHGLSGAEMTSSFWPVISGTLLVLLLANLVLVSLSQPRWPVTAKKYLDKEAVGEDTISLWESQRNSGS